MTNVAWQSHKVSKEMRRRQHGHKSCLLWFTGLSGAGKSTIAGELEYQLVDAFNIKTYLLDGDNLRLGLCRDLGFDEADRIENIRRVGEVSKLFVDSGLITLAAFISPFRKDRALVRAMLAVDEFIEVFVDTPLNVCEQRDPKGLYQRARLGQIKHFTGLDSPYEAPRNPEIHLKNAEQSPAQSVAQILSYLTAHDYL